MDLADKNEKRQSETAILASFFKNYHYMYPFI